VGVRHTCVLVLMAACFQPLPPEGAPCTTSAECPASLSCYANQCLSEPPEGVPGDPDQAPPDEPPVDPPNVACPDALQCDGFEGDDLTAWTINFSVGDATVVVSDAQAHTGMRSLQAVVPQKDFSGSSAYVSRSSAMQSTGVLAARAWVYPLQPVKDFSGVLRFSSDDRYVMLSGDSNQRWTVTENGPDAFLDYASTVTALADRWTCVEMVYSFSPPRIQLYIDAELVLDQPAGDKSPAFSQAGAGVTRAPVGGFSVFVDDFVIANQHIGCD
jgi:hypothetical protein